VRHQVSLHEAGARVVPIRIGANRHLRLHQTARFCPTPSLQLEPLPVGANSRPIVAALTLLRCAMIFGRHTNSPCRWSAATTSAGWLQTASHTESPALPRCGSAAPTSRLHTRASDHRARDQPWSPKKSIGTVPCERRYEALGRRTTGCSQLSQRTPQDASLLLLRCPCIPVVRNLRNLPSRRRIQPHRFAPILAMFQRDHRSDQGRLASGVRVHFGSEAP